MHTFVQKHPCSTAAQLEFHLGATFEPTKKREAIFETLASTWLHPVRECKCTLKKDGTHWTMSHACLCLNIDIYGWKMCTEFGTYKNAGTINVKSLLGPWRNWKTGAHAHTHTHTNTHARSYCCSRFFFYHYSFILITSITASQRRF